MTDSSPSIVFQECLAKAQDGDPSARDRLFTECRSYLGLLARANLQPWIQSKVDASDLVQQTLMDAHRDFERFRGKTDQEWLAWLRQILNHNACDAARHYGTGGRRAARREVSLGNQRGDSSPPCEPPSPAESPSQLAIHNENELRLANAMDLLPEDYREVIILRNIQRLPFDAVADQMGRTRPAAQMLWMRAIQKLKSLLSAVGSGVSRGDDR